MMTPEDYKQGLVENAISYGEQFRYFKELGLGEERKKAHKEFMKFWRLIKHPELQKITFNAYWDAFENLGHPEEEDI